VRPRWRRRRGRGVNDAFGWAPFWWLATAGSLAAVWLRALNWPWPQGPLLYRWAWVGFCLAGVAWTTACHRRSALWQARRDLIIAAAAHRDGVWLDRDAHRAFRVSPERFLGLRMWVVVAMNEDDGAELDALPDGEEIPVTFEQYFAIPGTVAVIRSDHTVLATPGDGYGADVRQVPGTPGPFRTAWRRLQMESTGLGTTVPDAADVLGLAEQLTAAEPMGDPEPPGEDQ
jgi:hypothetical protein